MITEKFEDFFEHEEMKIRVAARYLANVQAKYEAKDITASEFKELAEDALEIDEISGLSEHLEHKVMISKALDTLKMIAKFIPI